MVSHGYGGTDLVKTSELKCFHCCLPRRESPVLLVSSLARDGDIWILI